MTRTIMLAASATVPLVSSGAALYASTYTATYAGTADSGATAATGPLSPGEQWSGLTVSVRAATHASEAICRIYAGPSPTPGYFAWATTWGSTGASSANMPVVRVGGYVWAVWTGGDPGALATMTVRGKRTVA